METRSWLFTKTDTLIGHGKGCGDFVIVSRQPSWLDALAAEVAIAVKKMHAGLQHNERYIRGIR